MKFFTVLLPVFIKEHKHDLFAINRDRDRMRKRSRSKERDRKGGWYSSLICQGQCTGMVVFVDLFKEICDSKCCNRNFRM